MQQESAQPGLFWAALVMAGLVLVAILAKPLLGVKDRKDHRWLGFVLAGSLIAAGFVLGRHAPRQAAPSRAGWSSIHAPLDHKPFTGRDLLQRT